MRSGIVSVVCVFVTRRTIRCGKFELKLEKRSIYFYGESSSLLSFVIIRFCYYILIFSAEDVQPFEFSRRSMPNDILCTKSCQYLKVNGYFNKYTTLKNLCLATYRKFTLNNIYDAAF